MSTTIDYGLSTDTVSDLTFESQTPFPNEIWCLIIDLLSAKNDVCLLVPLLSVCKTLNHLTKQTVLYRQSRVTELRWITERHLIFQSATDFSNFLSWPNGFIEACDSVAVVCQLTRHRLTLSDFQLIFPEPWWNASQDWNKPPGTPYNHAYSKFEGESMNLCGLLSGICSFFWRTPCCEAFGILIRIAERLIARYPITRDLKHDLDAIRFGIAWGVPSLDNIDEESMDITYDSGFKGVRIRRGNASTLALLFHIMQICLGVRDLRELISPTPQQLENWTRGSLSRRDKIPDMTQVWLEVNKEQKKALLGDALHRCVQNGCFQQELLI